MSGKLKELLSQGHTRIERKKRGPDPKKKKSLKAEVADNDFIVRDIPGWLREALELVVRHNIRPKELQALQMMSDDQQELLSLLPLLQPGEAKVIRSVLQDEKPVRLFKLTLLRFLNWLSGQRWGRTVMITLTETFSKIRYPG